MLHLPQTAQLLVVLYSKLIDLTARQIQLLHTRAASPTSRQQPSNGRLKGVDCLSTANDLQGNMPDCEWSFALSSGVKQPKHLTSKSLNSRPQRSKISSMEEDRPEHLWGSETIPQHTRHIRSKFRNRNEVNVVRANVLRPPGLNKPENALLTSYALTPCCLLQITAITKGKRYIPIHQASLPEPVYTADWAALCLKSPWQSPWRATGHRNQLLIIWLRPIRRREIISVRQRLLWRKEAALALHAHMLPPKRRTIKHLLQHTTSSHASLGEPTEGIVQIPSTKIKELEKKRS